MSWKCEGDRVRIEMPVGDWQWLLLIMGFAIASASKANEPLGRAFARVVNRINDGNPNFHQLPVSELVKALHT